MSQAIIKTGGKQYLVTPGQKLKIEKINGKEGDNVKFETLLITDDQGDKVELGTPVLKTTVEGKILKQAKDKKVMVVKYKAKTRYLRRKGHRQNFTQVEISKI